MYALQQSWRNIRQSILPFQVDQQYAAVKNYRHYQGLRTRTDIKSFEPFEHNKCIFIHIPKNGGMAVNKGLFDGKMIGGHYCASYFKIVFGKQFDEYLKFAIVRNPWDRLVSAYEYLKGGGMDQMDRDWEQKHIGQFTDFRSFVNGWVNDRNVRKGMHTMPQFEFVCDRSGQLVLDYVGRFEHFNESYQEICIQLGVAGRSLPHTNRSSRKKDYRPYYSDREVEVVSRVYKKDIQLFGYEFD